MNLKQLLCFVFFINYQFSFSQENLIRCGNSFLDSIQFTKNSDFFKQRLLLNETIKSRIQSLKKDGSTSSIITIPIVMHILYYKDSASQNIQENQILSQIDVLNEDFGRKSGTNGFNSNPLSKDSGIRFRLAGTSPDGLPTNGIVRVEVTEKSFELKDEIKIKSYSYWPSNQYLNIWVCNLRGFIGVGQFPDMLNMAGIASIGGASFTDGIIARYSCVGRVGKLNRNYNLGRTITHELGHWLGLLHPWGDENCGEDFCDDTPKEDFPNNVLNCSIKTSICSNVTTNPMIENYMDYSLDRCMNTFTLCQIERMQTVLSISPRRISLKDSPGLKEVYSKESFDIYNVFGESKIIFKAEFFSKKIIEANIYDLNGRLLWSQFYPMFNETIEVDYIFLPKSIYILTVKNGNSIKRLKIVR